MAEKSRQQRSLTAESLLQGLLAVAVWAVVLWVRFDSTDSTLGKTGLVFTFSTLGFSFCLFLFLRGERAWFRSPVDLLIAGFLLLQVFSWLTSPLSRYGAETLHLLFGCSAAFWLALQLFRNQKSVVSFLNALSVLAALVCALAFAQYFGLLPVDFGLGDNLRVVSTLGNATYLAGFLLIMLPLEAASTAAAASSRRRILGGCLILLLLTVLFLTQSRSAILAAGFVLLLMFVVLRRTNLRVVLFGGAAFVVLIGTLIAVIPGMGGRLAEIANPEESISVQRRVVFWNAGLASVADSPFLGHGPGSYPFVVAEYRRPDYWVSGSEDIVPHAHNEFLELSVETGVAGPLLFAGIFGIVLFRGFRAGRSGGTGSRILAAGMSCAVLALLLDNVTGVSLRQAPTAMLGWILAGIILSPAFDGSGEKGMERFVHPRWSFQSVQWLRGPLSLATLTGWIVLMVSFWPGELARFHADSSLFKGKAQVSQGRYDEAVVHFRRSVQANPAGHVFRLDLAITEIRRGDYHGALATLAEIRKQVPEYPKTNLLESLSWLQLDSLDNALRAIRNEVRYRDHPEAFYTESLILARMDDTAGVRSALEKVLERNSAAGSQVHLDSSVKTLEELASTPEERGRLKDLLQRIVRYAPGNRVVASTLSRLSGD